MNLSNAPKKSAKTFVPLICALVYWGLVYGYTQLDLSLRELRAQTYAAYPQVITDAARVCLFACLGVLLLILLRRPIPSPSSLALECVLLLVPALICCAAGLPGYVPLPLGGFGYWLSHNAELLLPVGGVLLPFEIVRIARYARKVPESHLKK